VKASALLVASLALSSCGDPRPQISATPSPPPSGQLTAVFSDEFDTPGRPDPARWVHELGYIANNESQYYTDRSENSRVEGGMLVIEARKEAYRGYAYTSARLVTRGRFEPRYGRVEVRAKLPTGRGSWPAIWMLGASIDRVGWPACGEIDIMENVGFDPGRVHASVHTAAYNHVKGTQRTASIVPPVPPSDDFHVYTLDWRADRIEVAVDGVVYFSYANDGAGSASWPFDEPHYLLLNLAIGGSWGGQQGIDDAQFPKAFLVDYVRVFRRD
jgi:beta-glucanase (GH16 family)